MDLNSQNPQPEQKQSFWAKLFGGGKKEDASPAPMSDPAPSSVPSSDAAVTDTPSVATNFGTDAPAEPMASSAPDPAPAPFNPEPSAPVVEEQPLPPINGPEESAGIGADVATPVVEEVPQADVSKVDETLNSLPPLPAAPDEPAATPVGEVPQPPVDPMVNPMPSSVDAPSEDQTPTINP